MSAPRSVSSYSLTLAVGGRERGRMRSGTAGKRPGRMKHLGESGLPPITDHSSLIIHQSLCSAPTPHNHLRVYTHARVSAFPIRRVYIYTTPAPLPLRRGAMTDLLRARSVPRMMMLIARFQVFLESGRTISSIKSRRRLLYSNTALKSSSTRLVQRQQTTSQPFFKLQSLLICVSALTPVPLVSNTQLSRRYPFPRPPCVSHAGVL